MSKHRWIQPELRKVLTKLKMDDNQELRDGQDLLANMGLEVGIQVFLKLVELDCKRLYSTWDCPKNNFLHMQKILCAGLFVAWYIFMKREVTLMLALGTCIVNLLERGVAKPFALAIPPNGITAVLFLILKMIISKTSWQISDFCFKHFSSKPRPAEKDAWGTQHPHIIPLDVNRAPGQEPVPVSAKNLYQDFQGIECNGQEHLCI